MDEQFEDFIFGFGFKKITVLCLFYPIECAKAQIYISQTPTYGIKKIVEKIRHTYQIGGLQGCYTGIIPWLCCNMLYVSTVKITSRMFTTDRKVLDPPSQLRDERESKFLNQLSHGVVCRTMAVSVSHPLYVVASRMVAQIATKETKYSGLTAVAVIMGDEGLQGLFAGLLPRLMSDLAVYITTTTAGYLLKQFMPSNDVNLKRMLDDTALYLSRASFYQFTVMSSRMAVTNSGLFLGSPPHMPHYKNMFDCLSDLNCITKSRSPM